LHGIVGWFWGADGFWTAEDGWEKWLALVLFETRLHTSGESDGELDKPFKPDGVLVCSEMQLQVGV